MKKFLLIFLSLVLSLIICGCSDNSGSGKIAIPQTFESKINTSSDSGSFSADFSYNYGSFVLSMTSPETLKGVEVKKENGVYSLTYNSVKINAENPNAPYRIFAETLIKALRDTENTENLPENKDGLLVYTGESNYGVYELCVDSANGNIKTLSVEKSDVKAEFSNFIDSNEETTYNVL